MSDRELLELAAKAAGMNIRVEESWQPHIYAPFFHDEDKNGALWNPLTDDGDALRLAVKLGLEIYHSINNDRWSVFVGYPSGGRIVYVFDEWGDDENAATRRAIVRAAAAIGKATP